MGRSTSRYKIGDVLDCRGYNDVYLGTKAKYWDYEFSYENDGSISSIYINMFDEPKSLYFFCPESDYCFYGIAEKKKECHIVGHKDVPSIDERFDRMIDAQAKCKDMSELDYNYWAELHLSKWCYSEKITPKLINSIKALWPDVKIILKA